MIEIDECLQWLNCNTKVNHCEKTSISKQISNPPDVMGNKESI